MDPPVYRFPHKNLSCRQPCTRTMPCGHRCSELCGDKCRCTATKCSALRTGAGRPGRLNGRNTGERDDHFTDLEGFLGKDTLNSSDGSQLSSSGDSSSGLEAWRSWNPQTHDFKIQKERVAQVGEALEKANRDSGGTALATVRHTFRQVGVEAGERQVIAVTTTQEDLKLDTSSLEDSESQSNEDSSIDEGNGSAAASEMGPPEMNVAAESLSQQCHGLDLLPQGPSVNQNAWDTEFVTMSAIDDMWDDEAVAEEVELDLDDGRTSPCLSDLLNAIGACEGENDAGYEDQRMMNTEINRTDDELVPRNRNNEGTDKWSNTSDLILL